MGEFNADQQRAFCQFVTGAPRPPPGGLAVLSPKLTIVRKHSSTSNNAPTNAAGVLEAADDDLPSAMTCASYLSFLRIQPRFGICILFIEGRPLFPPVNELNYCQVLGFQQTLRTALSPY